MKDKTPSPQRCGRAPKNLGKTDCSVLTDGLEIDPAVEFMDQIQIREMKKRIKSIENPEYETCLECKRKVPVYSYGYKIKRFWCEKCNVYYEHNSQKTFADRLIAARLTVGFKTQAEAAAALGWKAQDYGRYETGNRRPGPDRILTICNMFKCDAGWLLGIKK